MDSQASGIISNTRDTAQQQMSRSASDSEHSAVSAAVRAVAWPGVVGMTQLLLQFGIAELPASEMVFWIVVAAPMLLFVSIFAGIGIGTLAHLMFYRRVHLSPNRVAISMALIFDFVLWGWIFVFTKTAHW